MTDQPESSKTAILFARWTDGDHKAVSELRRENPGNTLQPTALVHEVYLRMVSLRELNWQNRAHFLAMAARVTRQALVDEARRSRADKRNAGTPVTLSDENLGGIDAGYDALDVDAILIELRGFDETAAEVVSLRIFGGLSIEEAAEALSLSVRTTNRRWAAGKAWLAYALAPRA